MKKSNEKAVKFFEDNIIMLTSLEAPGERGCAEKCLRILKSTLKPRFYFVQRHRSTISQEYIKENMNDEWCVKPFETYEEAHRYDVNGFWDDSDHGVFFRTDSGLFVRMR